MATGHYVPMLVFGALYQIVPERVMAAAGSPLWVLTLAGGATARAGPRCCSSMAGSARGPNKDGVSCLSWPSNISSTPVEVAERNNPIFFHHKRLRQGSGGGGQYRGGLGQDVADRDRVAMTTSPRCLSSSAPRSPRPGSAAARPVGSAS